MSSETSLLKYAKFYTDLRRIELEIRDAADLGYHLNVETALLNQLNSAARAIELYLKAKAENFENL